MSDKSRYVFLDRDGVINVERGTYTINRDEWQWEPSCMSGMKKLHDAGFDVIVITNQACIGKGLQTEEGLGILHDWMKHEIEQAGGFIRAIYHCPHLTEDDCICRKPEPGMILQASQDFAIDLTRSFMIGDSLRDMEAGRRAGTRTIRIIGGPGSDSTRTQFETGEFEAHDLLEAAEIVIRETERI